jgi:hypothetical protein
MNYKSEEIFLNNVENCLKNCGCKTWREIIPDNCKDWEKPYRVDLIFYRNDFGYIGVEGKNINSLRSAKKISDAINQINNKYKNQTYFNGNIISRWCIVAPMEVDWISDEAINLMKEFLKNFLNSRYGISLMEYVPKNNTYNWDDSIRIDTTTKKSLYIRREK